MLSRLVCNDRALSFLTRKHANRQQHWRLLMGQTRGEPNQSVKLTRPARRLFAICKLLQPALQLTLIVRRRRVTRVVDAVTGVRAGYDRWAAVYDHDANPLQALEGPAVRA